MIAHLHIKPHPSTLVSRRIAAKDHALRDRAHQPASELRGKGQMERTGAAASSSAVSDLHYPPRYRHTTYLPPSYRIVSQKFPYGKSPNVGLIFKSPFNILLNPPRIIPTLPSFFLFFFFFFFFPCEGMPACLSALRYISILYLIAEHRAAHR
ncbi:hypothetical protein L873DRAFT_1169954 [Choiromyces venosus 120613-1]|uniref:Uncharacterized protein n=1 Tax=Choiromyces venosus 120613-1 TaxID=1336337 RepID=A0A3N4K2E3_9PEZI|nr:hypothetical protein L873DRAFT_1169954 [Choiromyces venosus 120613-1]